MLEGVAVGRLDESWKGQPAPNVRAALQEPLLDGPRAGEETLRELKVLADHRDDLVAERRRCQ